MGKPLGPICACGCGKHAKVGNKFLVGHSGNKKGGPNFTPGHQTARKVPVGCPPPSHESKARSAYMAAYRDAKPDAINAAKNRARLMAFYRITPEEQQAIDKFQAGHEVFSLLLGRRLGTDHNHRTGLIRGRLDFRLNQAYGRIENAFPDNTADVLRALADFHDNPPATTVLGAPRYGLIGKAKYKRKMIYGPPQIAE